MAARSSAVYRWAGAALLRASTDPGGLDLPEDLDLFGDDTAQRGLAWLSAVWQREEVRAALGEASPTLSRQIDAMVALGSRDASRVRRAVISLASYVLRWQQRPTPFGLFAGVGLARIGARAEVRWGREHRVTVRADTASLGDVLARLHQCAELLERLSVVVNDAGSVRGDRFVAPGPAPDGVPQTLAPIEVSVRHSRPVRTALEAACELAGLLSQRTLISNLRAPMTCPDALGHACAELEAADAHSIPEISDVPVTRPVAGLRYLPATGWSSPAKRILLDVTVTWVPSAVRSGPHHLREITYDESPHEHTPRHERQHCRQGRAG